MTDNSTTNLRAGPGGEAPTSLRERIDRHGWNQASATDTNVRTVGFIAVWVSCGLVAHLVGLPAAVAAWFVAGWILTGALAASHEAIHNNLYRSRTANRAVGWAWAGVAAIPFETYRAYHRAHHADTKGPTDPEPHPEIGSAVAHLATFAVGGVYFWLEMWVPTLRVMVGGRGPRWVTGRARARMAANGWAIVAATAAFWVIVDPSLGVVWSWWAAPMLVAAVFCAPLVALPEHHRTSDGPGPATATSRTVLSVPACRWVMWNANYHTAHHLVPSVPGRHLPELDAVIAADCEHRADTYLGWHARELRRHQS